MVCAESVAIIEACLEDENASFPAQSMCRFIDICGIRCPAARGGAEEGEGGAGGRSADPEADRLWRLAIGVVERLLARRDHSSAGISDVCRRMLTYVC